MNTAGGDTWGTAGTIDAAGTTPATHLSDLFAGSGDPPTYSYWLAWWTITMPADTLITLDGSPTTSSDPDTNGDCDLFVYTGPDEASAVQYVVDFDSGTNNRPRKTFFAAAGVTYHVVLGTWDPTGNGLIDYLFDITMVDVDVPPNDDVASAVPITLDTDLMVIVAHATMESGEPDESSLYRSIWYEFTPPVSGMYGFDVIENDSTSGSVLTVFTGSSYADLVTIGYRFGPDQWFEGDAGTTYLLRVSAQDEETNFISLRLRRYQWGDWIQDVDYTVTSTASFQTRSLYAEDTPPDRNEVVGDSVDVVPFLNDSLVDLWSGISAIYAGVNPDFFTTPTEGIVVSGLTTSVDHEWTFFGAISNPDPDGNKSVEVAGHQFAGVLYARPVDPNTYDDTYGIEWEGHYGVPVGGSVVYDYVVYLGASAMFGSIVAKESRWTYYPTEIDATLMHAPFFSRKLSDPTAIAPGTLTETITTTYGDGDFAGVDARSGVLIYSRLTVDDAPQVTSWSHTEFAMQVKTTMTVDHEATTWTIRPPRYRLIEVVEGTPPAPAPLVLYPRSDGRSGPRRVYPHPPSARAHGHY